MVSPGRIARGLWIGWMGLTACTLWILNSPALEDEHELLLLYAGTMMLLPCWPLALVPLYLMGGVGPFVPEQPLYRGLFEVSLFFGVFGAGYVQWFVLVPRGVRALRERGAGLVELRIVGPRGEDRVEALSNSDSERPAADESDSHAAGRGSRLEQP